MLVFKTIRYKNFLSSGNEFTEIELNRSPTTLILGENGSGKSTMLDALCFALFGKPFRRINKPLLVNSVNGKKCHVELEFDIGPNEYRIVRGIKPARFEIYYNDTMLDQDAAIKDTQEHLEKNILKLNHTSFTQIVILGSSTFVPFMQLPAARRREVIEDLLDIKIFTLMNQILKNNIQQNKDVLSEIKHKLQLENEKRKLIERQIDQLNQKRLERGTDLEGQVKTTEIDIQTRKEKLARIVDDMRGLVKIMGDDEFEAAIAVCDSNINSLRKNTKQETKILRFYEDNTTCPTCQSEMDDDFREKQMDKHRGFIVGYEEEMMKLAVEKGELMAKNDKLVALNNEHLELANAHADLQAEIHSLQMCHTMLLEEHAKSLIDDTVEQQQQLNSCVAKLKKVMELRQKAIEQRELLTAAGELLKDKGIKTQIVKQYIPIMNKLINKYLAQMEFFVDFNLDENFNEVIRSRHRDEFSYGSFSEGEKARLDLALMLTWRSIARMKNSAHTNLLILDEVFDGSLDSIGLESLSGILDEMNGSNIFVISHKSGQLRERMRSVITFEKVKNFSRIVQDEE